MKIYVADVTNLTIEHLETLVSAARIERSRKYKFEIDRRRSLGVEALLNYALRAEYPEIQTPVQLERDEFEKPHLIAEHIEFSLSHAGSYAACLVDELPVGVDIEKHKDCNQGIARRFFTKRECADITDDERFYMYWTLKESFLKAVGRGLSLPMNSFEVEFDRQEQRILYKHQVNENKYYGKLYEFAEGYSLAVCRQGEGEFPEEIVRAEL